MNRRKWLWTALLALPLAVVGVVYANSQQARSYVCPITGEELPCPLCCPLNDAKTAKAKDSKAVGQTEAKAECPLCCSQDAKAVSQTKAKP